MRKLLGIGVLCMGLSGVAFAEEAPVCQAPCAESAAAAPAKAAETQLELSGKLRIVGTSKFPVIVLSTKEGKDIALDGKLLVELRGLQRLTLAVKGVAMEKNGLYERLDVRSYEILDAGNGQKPYVGVLELVDGKPALRLMDQAAPLALEGNEKVQGKLKAALGGKAWVVGELEGATLRIKRFAVITGEAQP